MTSDVTICESPGLCGRAGFSNEPGVWFETMSRVYGRAYDYLDQFCRSTGCAHAPEVTFAGLNTKLRTT